MYGIGLKQKIFKGRKSGRYTNQLPRRPILQPPQIHFIGKGGVIQHSPSMGIHPLAKGGFTTLDVLKWGAIASPHDKFDPDVVREFYANAYPSEEGGGLFEHKLWVRGKVIWYDRDYMNMMLNNPYELRDGHLDGYHSMVEKSGTIAHGFAINETVQQLCIPGRTVSAYVDGHPNKIYRKDMTTLA
ncbi:hypothetical protein Lal_00041805 [Lupinus albus]|nr:hypothetical protein Lal_00041805 [Lupinus albus]